MAANVPPRRSPAKPGGPKPGNKPAPRAGGDSPAAPAAPPTGIAGVQWRNLAIVGGVIAILWLMAFASGSKIVVGIVAVLTLAIVGLLLYVLRWARKQRAMMELLQSANASPEARKEALAKLEAQSGADKDVMNAIARAQLEAQEDPDKALATLESIDIAKVPMTMADDVRAFRAQMYLITGRPREAREQADHIKVTNAGQPESRGMLAATVAEAWGRTGKHKEALELLGTIKPEDDAYTQSRVPLLYARIYACFAAGQRENVKRDLNTLLAQDMNLLGRFVAPKARVPLELQKLAKDVLQRSPEVRKMMQKQASRQQRRMR